MPPQKPQKPTPQQPLANYPDADQVAGRGPAAIRPPVEVSTDTTALLGQINGGLTAAKQTVDSFARQFAAIVQAQLGLAQVSATSCQSVIAGVLQEAVRQALEQCANDTQCVEAYVHAATSSMWEIAAAAGCPPMPSLADLGLGPNGQPPPPPPPPAAVPVEGGYHSVTTSPPPCPPQTAGGAYIDGSERQMEYCRQQAQYASETTGVNFDVAYRQCMDALTQQCVSGYNTLPSGNGDTHSLWPFPQSQPPIGGPAAVAEPGFVRSAGGVLVPASAGVAQVRPFAPQVGQAGAHPIVFKQPPPPPPPPPGGGGAVDPRWPNCAPPPVPPPPQVVPPVWQAHQAGPWTVPLTGTVFDTSMGTACGAPMKFTTPAGHGGGWTVNVAQNGHCSAFYVGPFGQPEVPIAYTDAFKASLTAWIADCESKCGAGGGGSGGGGGGGGGGPCPPPTIVVQPCCPPPPPPPVCKPCPVCQCKPCKCQRPDTSKYCVYKLADGTCYVQPPQPALCDPTSGQDCAYLGGGGGGGPINLGAHPILFPTDTGGGGGGGSSGGPPADSTLMGCYDTQQDAEAAAAECQQQQQPQPFEPPLSPPGPTGSILCGMDVAQTLPSFGFDITPIEFGGLADFVAAFAGAPAAAPGLLDAVLAMFPGGETVLKPWAAALLNFASLFGQMGMQTLNGEGCINPTTAGLFLWRALIGFCEKWLSSAAGDLNITPTYLSNYYCPRLIPTTAEAQAAYLSGYIDQDLLQAWTMLNGNCWEPSLAVLDARRTKQDANTLVQLLFRGQISQQEYQKRFRSLGFIDDFSAQDAVNLYQQIPPVSELIRMMVRDVADNALVAQFGMDDDFTNKWTGQLKEWGHQQGITDQFAQYEWRAHWSIPAPGQLFEMFRRLRHRPQGDPLRVDLPTVKAALQQQDILPFWIDKFLEITFHPINLTEVQKGYQIGAITQSQMTEAFIDLGYNDGNAQVLTDYYVKQKSLACRNSMPVKQYVRGDLTIFEANQALLDVGYTTQEIDPAIQWGMTLRKGKVRSKCRRAIRTRYYLGEINPVDLPAALQGIGYDADQAQDFANEMICENTARGKTAPMRVLCQWYNQGIIDSAGIVQRLLNLGWTNLEAVNFAQNCKLLKTEADQKKLAAEQAKLQRQQQKAARQAQQLVRQQQRAAAKAAQQVAAMQQAASRRQHAMLVAAEKYARYQGGSVADRMTEVQDAVAWVRSNTDLGYDDAIAVAQLAADQEYKGQTTPYLVLVQNAAAGWDTAEKLLPDVVAGV